MAERVGFSDIGRLSRSSQPWFFGRGGEYSDTVFNNYLKNAAAINLERLREYLTSGGSTGFYLVVNDEELVKQIDVFLGNHRMYNATIAQARAAFLPQVKPILGEIIVDIADNQSDGAFPREFVDSLLGAIYRLPDATISGNAPHLVTVQIPNLYEHLGAEDEYAAAFHHGALLPASAHINSGPFLRKDLRADVRVQTVDWGNLRTQDPAQRYRYWKALYQGKKTIRLNRGSEFADEFGLSASVEVPIAGSWEETKQARLAAWKRAKPGGAPQWLLLEYGQPKWQPTIKIEGTGYTSKIKTRSTSVIGKQLQLLTGINRFTYSSDTQEYSIPGNISARWVGALSKEWTQVVMSVWAKQIDDFNKTSTKVVYDAKSHSLRSPITGRFMARSTSGPMFPNRSSRLVEPYGPKFGPGVQFRNSPISDDEFWDSIGGLQEIFDGDY